MGNIERIVNYIRSGEKKGQYLGVELEHFVVNEAGKAIDYVTMQECLRKWQEKYGGQLLEEAGAVLGVDCEDYMLSLEPACQLEISIARQEQIAGIENVYQIFLANADEVFGKKGYCLVATGIHPQVENAIRKPQDFPMIPKKRYECMSDYFAKKGDWGYYMMRATAATQISIDYESEKDAMRKLVLIHKMAPLLSLYMENQNGLELMNGFLPHLLRMQIWNGVDEERCGYIPGNFEDYSFEHYAKAVCEGTLLYHPDKGLVEGCTKEHYDKMQEAEIAHAISMFFWHVRLKRCLEIRVADSTDIDRVLGYATLLKGILYNEENMSIAEVMLQDIQSPRHVKQAEDAIMRYGFEADIFGKKAKDILWDLCEMVMEHLTMEEKRYLLRSMPLPVIHEGCVSYVKRDLPKHMAAAKGFREYILSSTAKYHNRAVKSLYIPKMFRTEDINNFQKLLDILYGIFAKIFQRYREDAAYRELFGFPKVVEEMILREESYDAMIPIARIDIFYNEATKGFWFCEFNTDGSSAMNEDREMNIALKATPLGQFVDNHWGAEGFELFDTWVESFAQIYEDFAMRYHRKKVPRVAIVDFMESATTNEFVIFSERFRAKGMPCEICDIRELIYENGKLKTPTGMEIDAIYRRAVTSDIVKHLEEVQSFMQAVCDNAVCLVGDFKTQIAHSKAIFRILHMDETKSFLTDEEKAYVMAHVPLTTALTKEFFEKHPDVWEDVLSNKNAWIIKPVDSYGSKGVHAGVESDDDVWRTFVEEAIGQDYILQRFCEPYRCDNIELCIDAVEDARWVTVSNLTGLFTYNGKFAGVYSRISYDKMISTQYNEMAIPTILLDKR